MRRSQPSLACLIADSVRTMTTHGSPELSEAKIGHPFLDVSDVQVVTA